MPGIEVSRLGRRFGGLRAVDDVSFSVERGEIFGIIGPNGAGKSTLFNLIAGLFRPSAGRVAFESRDITGLPSDAVARIGIGRTFQGVHAFRDLTALDNLRRAALLAHACDPLRYMRNALSRQPASRAADCEAIAQLVGLSDVLHATAGGLPYGSKKLLGIGMAMMQSPKVLLMDEPAAGLNPTEKRRLGDVIRRIRDEQGVDVLLVEHDMRLIMGICDRVMVLNQGRMIAIGTPDEVKAHPAVIEAYLGADYEFA
ncbi:ABC transporter ATP-binding protein [Paraburkholderia sp. SIMBA_053]|uniref:ABC transporter ATP-binding protein n=1 Tax=Paraburkholderia sp. SIMBA_053 TaxID=3085794 RepID=UPI0039795DA8